MEVMATRSNEMMRPHSNRKEYARCSLNIATGHIPPASINVYHAAKCVQSIQMPGVLDVENPFVAAIIWRQVAQRICSVGSASWPGSQMDEKRREESAGLSRT